MTRKEMAAVYGVTRQTFSRWIKSLNLPRIRSFTPAQIYLIHQLLGKP